MAKKPVDRKGEGAPGYGEILAEVATLIGEARRSAVRAVNASMTALYWRIGHRIVEFEQGGEERAQYGEEILKRLSADLISKFGRGFSIRNLRQMRLLYLNYPQDRIRQTASAEFPKAQKHRQLSAALDLIEIGECFRLPWSCYVLLLSVKSDQGRQFYEAEALRGGWSVRQLKRQIDSQFYERTALSRDKASMLAKGQETLDEVQVSPLEEMKDPYLLEFLNLKDEYSESDFEEGLIHHLQEFLLELGGDFCFVGREKRLRVGDAWYRVDLVFFHRQLRCLVVIDLKIGGFTPADAGQMICT